MAIEGPRGPEPFAVIIPHRGHAGEDATAAGIDAANANIDAAVKRANQQLAEYQHVRRWSIWPDPDFPRTSTHKILKREVSKSLDHQASEPQSVSSNPPDLLSLAPATRLSDLQLDSLARVELLSALEDRYQISIDEAAFTAATTFIVAFGAPKALTNLVTGALTDRVGRKPMLVAGWLTALPIPFLLILAPRTGGG